MNKPSARRIEYEYHPPVFAPTKVAGPFTADRLREIIVRHVAGRTDLPPERRLEALATFLNQICAGHQAARAAKTSQKRAAEVRYAFWVLACFFEERRQACEKPGIDRQAVENERRLCHQFDALVRMMGDTPPELDMDAGLTAPPYERWRDVAPLIGRAYQLVMEEAGIKLGLSNEGPVARFTAAVLGVITGEEPNVPDVGQHLRQPYRRRRNR